MLIPQTAVFQVNVPVQGVLVEGASSPTHMATATYIVESLEHEEMVEEEDVGDVDESSLPRVVEVVINEEQQAVSSITLLGDPSRWA